jgi:hypothetical protein
MLDRSIEETDQTNKVTDIDKIGRGSARRNEWDVRRADNAKELQRVGRTEIPSQKGVADFPQRSHLWRRGEYPHPSSTLGSPVSEWVSKRRREGSNAEEGGGNAYRAAVSRTKSARTVGDTAGGDTSARCGLVSRGGRRNRGTLGCIFILGYTRGRRGLGKWAPMD